MNTFEPRACTSDMKMVQISFQPTAAWHAASELSWDQKDNTRQNCPSTFCHLQTMFWLNNWYSVHTKRQFASQRNWQCWCTLFCPQWSQHHRRRKVWRGTGAGSGSLWTSARRAHPESAQTPAEHSASSTGAQHETICGHVQYNACVRAHTWLPAATNEPSMQIPLSSCRRISIIWVAENSPAGRDHHVKSGWHLKNQVTLTKQWTIRARTSCWRAFCRHEVKNCNFPSCRHGKIGTTV